MSAAAVALASYAIHTTGCCFRRCELCGGFDRVVDPVADQRERNLALIIGAIGLLLILICGGCTSVPRDIQSEEGVFQAEHLVDTLQTLDLRHTRFSEVQCNEFMGHRPSDASVWQYMSGEHWRTPASLRCCYPATHRPRASGKHSP